MGFIIGRGTGQEGETRGTTEARAGADGGKGGGVEIQAQICNGSLTRMRMTDTDI